MAKGYCATSARAIVASALDDGATLGAVTVAGVGIAADDVDRIAEAHRAREVARRRHRLDRLPSRARRVEPERARKALAERLRLTTEEKDRTAPFRGAGGAARLDRRAAGPRVPARIVEVDFAEVGRAAAPADRAELAAVRQRCRAAFGAWQGRQPGPAAAADDVDRPVEH